MQAALNTDRDYSCRSLLFAGQIRDQTDTWLREKKKLLHSATENLELLVAGNIRLLDPKWEAPHC